MRAAPTIRSHIGGRPHDAAGPVFTTIDPADGTVLAEVQSAGEAEVEAAVEAARPGSASGPA